MSHNFMLGRYYPIKSRIHLMNPVSKILCLILFIFLTFISTTIKANILLIILTIFILLLTSIPITMYLKTAKAILPLYIFIIIVNFIFKIPFVDTIIMMIRLTLVLFYFTMLTLTTPATEIIYGLEKVFSFLRIFKINVSKLALSITLFFRFLPNMMDEAHRIMKSQASRGIDYYSSNVKGKIYALRSMIGPAFIPAVKKSETLKETMLLRLYSTQRKRTNFRMNKLTWFDSMMIVIHIGILIIIIKGR